MPSPTPDNTTTTVRSNGIFHALPTYPPSSPAHRDLTAIVTGANGISGYHMVKVLAAAPERWAKIYCLSRRPPPDYFFEGLVQQEVSGGGRKGDGDDVRERVEHVEVDFLDSSGGIGKALGAKVKHV
jgi:NAD(P)-dependent dehydrogenase (short-subunit alcohol dehydrogenase family)